MFEKEKKVACTPSRLLNGASRTLSDSRSLRQMSDVGIGETEVTVLHYYTAQEGTPFPPDPRPEFSLIRGRKLYMIDTREDGYCVVRRPGTRREARPYHHNFNPAS